MITNKSIAIRLGKTKNWSVQIASSDSTYYNFGNNFKAFIDAFFLDSAFRDRGIAYSHTNINYARKSTSVQVFFQDAKISDFVGTFSRRPLYAFRRRKYSGYFERVKKRHPGRSLSFRQNLHKFVFRKRFLFSKSSRSYKINPFDFIKKTRHSFYSINFSRMRRNKRFKRFGRSYFTGFYNYFYSYKNNRLSYYSFLSRILSRFFFSFCNLPLTVAFNHVSPRHSTSDLYLNYICAKLYYRYILNDVVNPIVRLSLRQYRGFSINCKGRFTRAQIATQKNYRKGSLSFSYMKNHLDYAQRAVTLKYGTCNLKLWIRR